MNEKFTPDIVVSNPEQHKEELDKQMVKLQLLFCDRLYQQYKGECRKNSKPLDKHFSDILEEQEVYCAGDLRMLEVISSKKELSESELYELVKEKYYFKLNQLYNQLHDVDKDDNSSEYIKSRLKELDVLTDYFESEQKKVKEKYPDKWREITKRPKEENEQIDGMAGIIAYSPLEEKYNFNTNQIKIALVKEGFSESDKFLEISLPSQVEEAKKINSKNIKESLTCLAKKINDQHQDISAVVTESWLLSHPVFQRFIKMKVIGKGTNNWSQLISNSGQIEQNRLKKLLSTGKLPYDNLIGYISVEEFLKKYLPNSD
jgi:hypothetical protein